MSRLTVGEILGFQVVWIIAALGAASDRAWPGCLAAALYLAAHLSIGVDQPRTARLVVACGVVGFIAETLLVATGVVVYGAPWPSAALSPVWIVALWLAFGATLAPLARLLGDWRPVSIAVLGAVVSPMSYLAGERLGALVLRPPRPLALAALAVLWAGVLPLLVRLVPLFDRAASWPPAKKN